MNDEWMTYLLGALFVAAIMAENEKFPEPINKWVMYLFGGVIWLLYRFAQALFIAALIFVPGFAIWQTWKYFT